MALKITNINEFNAELKKAMKSVEGKEQEILSKTSFDTLRGLQRRTPKETGRAASGWIPTIDKKPSEYIPPKKQGHYPLNNFKDQNKIKADSIVNLTNNVEYIVPLDEGHSEQASTGIINFVLARAGAMLTSLIRKENKRVIR